MWRHFQQIIIKKKRFLSMNSFTQIVNPLTGEKEWQHIDENHYDYHQEVACSSFGDMLHDSERNQKYFEALKKTITALHKKGRKANVLDIGTGTGILSMMAVSCGADEVTACEAFLPIANCAEKIIESNKMSDKIKLIKKRSTEMIVGKNGDMPQKANVLVTEVFDTELIGEGAISIFNHAHKYLLEDDCVVIPHSAKIYAQVIESPLVIAWNVPKNIFSLDGDILLRTPQELINCPGEFTVHDIQLSQLPKNSFSAIFGPIVIFKIDFSSKAGIKKEKSVEIKFKSSKNGFAHAVFFWWDLKMDQDGEILLSCAPWWAHPDFKSLSKNKGNQKPIQNCIPWRDHWMQAIYYFPKAINLIKGEEYVLNGNHDEYSFWFDIWQKDSSKMNKERLQTICKFHMVYSRNRIGMMNDNSRLKKYLSILENTIDKNSKVLSLGDGCLLGLCAKVLGANSVTCLETNELSRNILELYIEENKLDNITIITNLEDVEHFEEFSHVIAEPWYITSTLPWHNFKFILQLNAIKDKLNEKVKILPKGAKICAVPVEFLDLQKIVTPIKNVEQFDLSHFDDLIISSYNKSVPKVEPQPLWEYPSRILGSKESVLLIDFEKTAQHIKQSGTINIQSSGTCNGIALWVDWLLNGNEKEKYIVSTGLLELTSVGDFGKWDMYTKQGVYFIKNPKYVKESDTIKYHVEFNFIQQNVNFTFEIN